MSPPKSQPRRYDSSGRRRQADEARHEILEAARRLFLDDGYGATTMNAIAAGAGVSVETIYGAWGSKAGVVEALLTSSVRGDDTATPFAEGRSIQSVITERDPRRQLELYAGVVAEVQGRLAPLTRILRGGAASDPKLAALLEQHKAQRLAGMTEFATLLQSRKALRKGLTVERARDILWTMNSSEVYDLLVTERSWTPEDYAAWIAESLASALLA
jgi:AcrR family transcriptional regulator